MLHFPAVLAVALAKSNLLTILKLPVFKPGVFDWPSSQALSLQDLNLFDSVLLELGEADGQHAVF